MPPKGHPPPTQAWAVFISIPLHVVRKTLYLTVYALIESACQYIVQSFCVLTDFCVT